MRMVHVFVRTVGDKYIEGRIPYEVACAALRGGMVGQEISIALQGGYEQYARKEWACWDIWLPYGINPDCPGRVFCLN